MQKQNAIEISNKQELVNKSILKKVIIIISVVFSIFHMYTAAMGQLPALEQRVVHLSFAMILIYLMYPIKMKRKDTALRVIDYVAAIMSAVAALYIMDQYRSLPDRAGLPTFADIILGVITILLVLEATRRVVGRPLLIIVTISLLYTYFGAYLPAPLGHNGVDISRVITHMWLTTEGIFTEPLGVSATYIILFILFGAFLEVSGGGQAFIDFAYSLFGKFRGGPAKMCIVASTLFGMISGSSVANVATVGTLTIPLMKKVGYNPEYAAAIEATASTGGQLMPPVMGATAFVIAEILGMSYWSIAVAAVVPAILKYAALFLMIDLEAKKNDIKGLPSSELPNFKESIKAAWPFFIPPIALVIMIGPLKYTPMKAGFWSIIIVMACTFLTKDRITLSKIVKSCESGTKGILQVALACASAGIVVGTFSLTGLGLKISTLLISAAHGNLAILLIITALASIILGMGLPTVAAYIVLAALIAPAMLKLGVMPLAAHMFVFYFGTLAVITPPVALSAYAAAGIANSDPLKTGWVAFKLALTAFAVPFVFIYQPALMLMGQPHEIIIVIVSVLIGIIGLSGMIEGFLLRDMNVFERILSGVAAVLLIVPEIITSVIGLVLIGFILLRQIILIKKCAESR